MSTVLNAKQIKDQLILGFTPAAPAAFIRFSLDAAKAAIDTLKMGSWDSSPLDVVAADLIYLTLLRLMFIQDQSAKLLSANGAYFTKLNVLPAMNDAYQRLLSFQCNGRDGDNTKFSVRQLWNSIKHDRIFPIRSQTLTRGTSPSLIYHMGSLCDDVVNKILEPLLQCTTEWLDCLTQNLPPNTFPIT